MLILYPPSYLLSKLILASFKFKIVRMKYIALLSVNLDSSARTCM